MSRCRTGRKEVGRVSTGSRQGPVHLPPLMNPTQPSGPQPRKVAVPRIFLFLTGHHGRSRGAGQASDGFFSPGKACFEVPRESARKRSIRQAEPATGQGCHDKYTVHLTPPTPWSRRRIPALELPDALRPVSLPDIPKPPAAYPPGRPLFMDGTVGGGSTGE